MARSTISMARSTPAQKPRGFASTSVSGVLAMLQLLRLMIRGPGMLGQSRLHGSRGLPRVARYLGSDPNTAGGGREGAGWLSLKHPGPILRQLRAGGTAGPGNPPPSL